MTAKCFYICCVHACNATMYRYVGTIDAQRMHAKVCARRDVACPITYCAKHSKRGRPTLLLPADTIVASTRKEHPYVKYVNNAFVIAYCEAKLKPPAKLPEKGVSWAICLHAAEGDDYLVECEYEQDRGAWLAGVVALNADKHAYTRANIKIGNNKYGQSRRVDVSVVNKTNLHENMSMNGVLANDTEFGISFYNDMVEDCTDINVTTMRVSVDLLRDMEYYPPIGSPKPTTVTVFPYAIGKYALPAPAAASVLNDVQNSNGAAAVAAATASNAAATTARALFRTNGDDDDDHTTLSGNVPVAGIDVPIVVESDDDSDRVQQTTMPAAMANMPSTSNSAANANAPAQPFVTPSRSNGEPNSRRRRLGSDSSYDMSDSSDDDTERASFAAATAPIRAAHALARSNAQVPAAQAPVAQGPRRAYHARYTSVAEREEAKRLQRERVNARRRQRTLDRRAAAATTNGTTATTSNGTTAATSNSPFNYDWAEAILNLQQ